MPHPFQQQVLAASGFELPPAYLALLDAGRLRFGDSREDWQENWQRIALENPPALLCSPWHTSVEWLTPQELLDWTPLDNWPANRLVAFAGDGYGDYWCWNPEQSTERGTPIVIPRHDEDCVEIYAASFEDFLFRVLLESFAEITYDSRDELLVDDEELKRYLALNVDAVAEQLSPGQVGILREVLDNDLVEDEDDECYRLVSLEEKQAILEREVFIGEVGQKLDF